MNTLDVKPNDFLLHWILNALGVWLVASVAILVSWTPIAIIISILNQYPLLEPLVPIISTIALFTLPGLSIGYVIGDMQQRLLHNFLRWNFGTEWVRVSSFGGLLGGILAMGTLFLVGHHLSERMQWMIALPLFILPMSFLQWRILREVANNAWLWILGNVVATIVFSGLFFSTQPMPFELIDPLHGILMWLLAASALGIITGIVMLWLYEHPRTGWHEPNDELAPVYIEVRTRDDQ
ncbi:MAG: hypothetical protein AAFV93_23645 [Chloroflexota bacterium]